MKKTITFLYLIFFSICSNAQDSTSNTISLATNFYKNDTLKYLIEEGKKKYLNDKIIDSTITEKKMNLIVIDSTEKGFLMQIDMVNDKKTDALVQEFLQDESNLSFLYSFKDLKLQYRISPVGVFEGFENMDIMKKMMGKTFDFYFEKMKVEPKKAEGIKKTYLNDAGLAHILGKYVTLLHAFHGYEYIADTIKKSDNELPNLFDSKGGTIPAQSEFLIEYTDSTGIYAELQQTTIANKEAMKKFMKDAGNTLHWDKKLKKDIKDFEMNLFQKITCEYYLPSGVPTYLFFKKVIDTKEKDKNDVNVTLEYIEINLQ